MKREHIEILWNACGSFETGLIAGPELMHISPELYYEWEHKKILRDKFETNKVLVSEHGIKGPVSIGPSLIADDLDSYTVYNAISEFDEGYIKSDTDITLYKVSKGQLASWIAKAWDLTPEYKEIKEWGTMIGYLDKDVPVVILYHQNISYEVFQAEEILKYLESSRLLIIFMGVVELVNSEHKRLNAKGVVYLGLNEFLTEDGKLKWDYDTIMNRVDPLLATPWRLGSKLDPITFNGMVLDLTPMHEALLRTLLLSFPKPATRAALIDAMYPKGGVNNEQRNLTDQISKLRKALPQDAATWIKSVRSKGYVIRPPNTNH